MKKKASQQKTKEVGIQENHEKNRLSDVILGGQDGLVNVLGVILGVAAATSETRIVLAAGLAATFAESISMAAVAYTSNIAARDYYHAQLERERREIRTAPEVEKEEVREIYRKKGFEGKLLEEIVQVITSDEKVWLDTMMQEELQLSPVETKRPFRAALVVGISAIIGSLVPLVPFLLLPMYPAPLLHFASFSFSFSPAIFSSIGLSAMVLFIVGYVKSKMTVGHPWKSGLEIALIGIISALVGYAIGLLFTNGSVAI